MRSNNLLGPTHNIKYILDGDDDDDDDNDDSVIRRSRQLMLKLILDFIPLTATPYGLC